MRTAANVDPFGVSWYLSRPALLFMGWGKLGELIGGIDLFHMRLLHALVGLLRSPFAMRSSGTCSRAGWAAFATLLFGAATRCS